VLSGNGVAGFLGYPLPVRTRRSLNARPFRYSSRCPGPGKRLPGLSSHGVRPSFTVFPDVSARGLSTGAPLLGFVAPTAHQEEGVHVPAGYPTGRPGSCRECVGRSHPADYGAARRFSQPLSGFFFPPPSCHFQASGAPGVQPYRGLLLSRRSGSSSRPACPHDVHPAGCADPHPRRGHLPASLPLPRIFRQGPFIVFRASIRVRIDPHRRAMVSVLATDLPLMGFRLLMVCTRASRRDFRPATVTLRRPAVCRQTEARLRPTACCPRERTLSHETVLPSRGFPPSTASAVLKVVRCGLIRLPPIRLNPHAPSRARTRILAPSRPPCRSR
jgi:hypothetical protein